MDKETVLSRICTAKIDHIQLKKAQTPLFALEQKIQHLKPSISFSDRISNFKAQNKKAIIAEVKKASPSKGVLREDFDPAQIAAAYQQNGAACISVLTDEPYFQGSDNDLLAVKKAASIPVLRKDFMIDPYQIAESRALGADCILLIMAALDDSLAAELQQAATRYGMDVLVEVHDEYELERALLLSPRLVGVNNRNLKTLKIDLDTSARLLPLMPPSVLKVAESGLSDKETVNSLHNLGFDAFLMGEHFMTKNDPGIALAEIIA